MNKKLLAVMIILGFCLTVLSAATLEEILAQNAKTKGGVDKLNSVKSIHMKGNISQNGMEMAMEMWVKKPKFMRMQINAMGQNLVMAFDGNIAWWIMPMMGINEPQEMPESQKAGISENAEMLDEPLINFKELGHKIELLGEEELEGTKVYKLKLTKKDGKVVDYYLDAETGIELRTTQYVLNQDKEVKMESVLGDYKLVDGLMFPHQIDMLANGTPTGSMQVSEITVNPVVEDDFFKMEKKTESKPEQKK